MKSRDDKQKPSLGTKKERIRVLIADDHTIVREGLVSLLKRKSDMIVVAEASHGREAIESGKSIGLTSRCSICACLNWMASARSKKSGNWTKRPRLSC
jgi:hypothetical protein